MSDDNEDVLAVVRGPAAGLWNRMNTRLDDVLGGLRLDMLSRTPDEDCIAWLMNKRWMDQNLSEAFVRDMLGVALYRLARYEADHS